MGAGTQSARHQAAESRARHKNIAFVADGMKSDDPSQYVDLASQRYDSGRNEPELWSHDGYETFSKLTPKQPQPYVRGGPGRGRDSSRRGRDSSRRGREDCDRVPSRRPPEPPRGWGRARGFDERDVRRRESRPSPPPRGRRSSPYRYRPGRDAEAGAPRRRNGFASRSPPRSRPQSRPRSRSRSRSRRGRGRTSRLRSSSSSSSARVPPPRGRRGLAPPLRA